MVVGGGGGGGRGGWTVGEWVVGSHDIEAAQEQRRLAMFGKAAADMSAGKTGASGPTLLTSSFSRA